MVNCWISHVKNYAKTHNVSYPVAMIQAKASYKKMSGGTTMKEYGSHIFDSFTPGRQKTMIEQGKK